MDVSRHYLDKRVPQSTLFEKSLVKSRLFNVLYFKLIWPWNPSGLFSLYQPVSDCWIEHCFWPPAVLWDRSALLSGVKACQLLWPCHCLDREPLAGLQRCASARFSPFPPTQVSGTGEWGIPAIPLGAWEPPQWWPQSFPKPLANNIGMRQWDSWPWRVKWAERGALSPTLSKPHAQLLGHCLHTSVNS